MEEVRAFWEDYLDHDLAFEPQNKELADALLAFMPSLAPPVLRPFLNGIVTAQVDPRVLRACGLPAPSRARRTLSGAAMRAIGRSDPRPDSGDSGPSTADRIKKQVYPNGWSVQTLGTHLQAQAFDEKEPNP